MEFDKNGLVLDKLALVYNSVFEHLLSSHKTETDIPISICKSS